VGRVVNGLPNRVDRIKGLGNSIVPQAVIPIMRVIKHLMERGVSE
jgi:DNA (cytosine-5)-methyltransferase 1